MTVDFKNGKIAPIAAVACALISWSTARSQEAAPKAGTVERQYDLTYQTVEGRDLKLDLARPAEGDGPFPAILVIHGGAWRGGDKSAHRDLLDRFAGLGYVAVSPQYRFCPEFTFPAQVHDVKAAVRWLKGHADLYHLDPDRVGAMGFSAGGHLALLLGVTDADDGLEGDAPEGSPDTRVQAVVNYFGPTDLAAATTSTVTAPLIRDFLGGDVAEKRELAAQASPARFVTSDDPPILTFQGTKDPLVSYQQALILLDAMSKVGEAGRVELIAGGGHGNWGRRELERTIEQTVLFFDKHLKPGS